MLEKDWLGITTISREVFIVNINVMLEGRSSWIHHGSCLGSRQKGSHAPAFSSGAELGLTG